MGTAGLHIQNYQRSHPRCRPHPNLLQIHPQRRHHRRRQGPPRDLRCHRRLFRRPRRRLSNRQCRQHQQRAHRHYLHRHHLPPPRLRPLPLHRHLRISEPLAAIPNASDFVTIRYDGETSPLCPEVWDGKSPDGTYAFGSKCPPIDRWREIEFVIADGIMTKAGTVLPAVSYSFVPGGDVNGCASVRPPW
jgi:hypothetical protein